MAERLTSKRNILMMSVIIILAVGIFGVIGTLSIFKVVEDVKKGIPFTKTMIIVPLIFYPFLLYSCYYMLTYFPTFTIDKKGIKVSTIFKTRHIRWTEVKEIQLSGKQPCRFLFVTQPIEATTILLNDNKKVYLWNGYYRNHAALRVILDRANRIIEEGRQFAGLSLNIERTKLYNKNISTSGGYEFNGNHLLTFNGLFFYGWTGFIIYMVSLKPEVFLVNWGAMISISLVTLMMAGLFSFQMHYFVITADYLIVKNTIWFWVKDVYPLVDIREAIIETPHKRSTSLRIITYDFREKLYSAGSLRNKTWHELIDTLAKNRIHVRNESVF